MFPDLQAEAHATAKVYFADAYNAVEATKTPVVTRLTPPALVTLILKGARVTTNNAPVHAAFDSRRSYHEGQYTVSWTDSEGHEHPSICDHRATFDLTVTT